MATRIVAPAGANPETTPVQGVTNQPAERELDILIWPDVFVEFTGTAAQLVAEGLIPEGFDWPKGTADREWKADSFEYWLRRSRPVGHKGPKCSWLEVDNWFIRVSVADRDRGWSARREIERKADELRATHHRYSPEGAREHAESFHAWWRARNDDRFQRVLGSILPARKKPGRKPKSSNAAPDGQAGT